MAITVSKITESEELRKAFDIRVKVFVEEQGVDKRLEYEHEDESQHFLAKLDGEPAGTARWRQTAKGIKLERFAVFPGKRGMKVGEALVEAILNDIKNTPGKIYLHAQSQVVDFYRKYGFETEGEEFEEAGIKHFVMVFKKVVS